MGLGERRRAREDSSAEPGDSSRPGPIPDNRAYASAAMASRRRHDPPHAAAPDRPTPTGPRPTRPSRCSSTAPLEPIVDMVLHRPRRRATRRSPTTGSVTFRRTDGRHLRTGRRSRAATRSPTSRPTSSRRSPTSAPTPTPHRSENAYPHAFDQIAQLFDAPAAPDLCVLHSAAHNWEDQGGHLGEHGSLGLVQARAPFVLAGKGVRKLGLVPQSARLVDVAPTICRAARLRAARDDDGTVPRGPGRRRRSPTCSSPTERPRYVVGFLFDGTNANVLYDMAARGEAPNVARAHRDGHRARARRDGVAADGHAREPHVDHHRRAPGPPRHPAQRVVRPRRPASR